MDRRNLPLKALRAFAAAAKHCHLGRAAEELGVTHGAVSHQVRALEEQLGQQLFDRSQGRLQLTPQGLRLQLSVDRAFDELLSGTRQLSGESLQGSLIVACPPGMMQLLLQHLAAFHENYPEIELRLEPRPVTQQGDVAEADIVISYGKTAFKRPSVVELLTRHYFPVCSPALLPEGEVPVSVQEMLQLQLVHDDNGEEWLHWLAQSGVSTLGCNNLFVGGYAYALEAARRGCGIALADQVIVADDLRQGRLLRLLAPQLSEAQSYYLCSARTDNMARRAQVFERWLCEVLGIDASEYG
jgi:LysR family glycine cleavage system transcriptional activator